MSTKFSNLSMRRIDPAGCGHSALQGRFASWDVHRSADSNKNKSASIEFDLDTVKMLMTIFVSPRRVSKKRTLQFAVHITDARSGR